MSSAIFGVSYFQFATFETFITALVDDFPSMFRKRRLHLTLAVAIVMFLLGLPQCMQVKWSVHTGY